MDQKTLSMLGLCRKAGRARTGGYQTEEAVKRGHACLVLIAEDASDRTKKSLRDMCTYYEVPFLIAGTKDEISAAVGQSNRSSVCVTDRGFADRISEMISGTDEDGGRKS